MTRNFAKRQSLVFRTIELAKTATRQFSIDNIMDLRLSWCYYLTGREMEARTLLDSVSPERFPSHEERTLEFGTTVFCRKPDLK